MDYIINYDIIDLAKIIYDMRRGKVQLIATSDKVDELIKALCNVQANMKGAFKNDRNDYYKSKYSNLESIINAIRVPFQENGLFFCQEPSSGKDNVKVHTKIIHTSGQWISSEATFIPDFVHNLKLAKTIQAVGSAMTYAKRYSLQGLVGIPSVDDDGNAASGITIDTIAKVSPIRTNKLTVTEVISTKEICRLRAMVKTANLTDERFLRFFFQS